MINYSCSGCNVQYNYTAEIIQSGGRLRYSDTRGIFPSGNIIFTCKCGEDITESDIFKLTSPMKP